MTIQSRYAIKTAKLMKKLFKIASKLDKYNMPFHIELSNKTYVEENKNV